MTESSFRLSPNWYDHPDYARGRIQSLPGEFYITLQGRENRLWL